MSGDSEQRLEEEQCRIHIAEDLYEILERTAEENGTTAELIANAILQEVLGTKTFAEILEIARDA